MKHIIIYCTFFTLLVHILCGNGITAEKDFYSDKNKSAVHEIRAQLKKYGISACILEVIYKNKLSENEARIISSTAMGGYVQLGHHFEHDAYKNVLDFVEQLQCTESIIQCCLDAFESPEGKEIIKKQDKFSAIEYYNSNKR